MRANVTRRIFSHSFPWPLIGPLEAEVMEIVWTLDECSVRQVMHRLPRKTAYTTVMTTLARLFSKKILTRRKVDRMFLYRPRFTPEEWRRRVAMQAAVFFLNTPNTSHEFLMSCLSEAMALPKASSLSVPARLARILRQQPTVSGKGKTNRHRRSQESIRSNVT
jgi:predicted transcriptional regulator